jgi:hypothetical protein
MATSKTAIGSGVVHHIPTVLPFTFNGQKFDPELPQSIELSRIYADRSWNVRSERAPDMAVLDKDGKPGTDDARRGFATIVCSLAKEPQRDPVLLRPNPNFVKGSKREDQREFSLVYGFQRHDAIKMIASQHAEAVEMLTNPHLGDMTQKDVELLSNPRPTIRAFVQQMTELEARVKNAAENMQHNALSSGDLVEAVRRIHAIAPDMSSVRMAIALNSGQPFIAKLIRIASGTGDAVIPAGALAQDQSEPVTILDAWRGMPSKGRITQNDMDAIAKEADPAKKVARFVEAATKKAEKVRDPNAPKGGKGSTWAENAAKVDAPRVAALLTTLQTLGVISINAPISGPAVVRACMAATGRNVPEKASDVELATISDAIRKAMGADAKASAKAGAKAGKGKTNGKGAHA